MTLKYMCEKLNCGILTNIAAQIGSEAPGFGPIDVRVNLKILCLL